MSLSVEDIPGLAWSKGDGLLPAVVQDADTGAVLMLAFMNAEALRETLARGRVVFYSRTRQKLWEKGETSGNTLELVDVDADCDADSLLVQARPRGPTCHRNTTTCFGDGAPVPSSGISFLAQLERVIAARIADSPEGSYTAKLYASGIKRMAQKVGEEGVETALAAQAGDNAELVSESADLLFHLALLLKARGLSLEAVAVELASRHQARQPGPRG
ncbi:MAG TPA: bifunctional phosphoribosyl-AMP cyclohydrolase/phosphoribosyl-ATP diphosphatase HisIE [Steroidobacteraceae bacterium]|nr:bifunctional phosphoribosyl-AMP cyclohydrolase/phosphoribosyl-ATP diphosphatase HisIE [Steroidobacteraceae bacterium]